MSNKPQTVDRAETRLIGYSVTASLNQDLATGIIGALRGKLRDRLREMGHPGETEGMYLVQVYPAEEWTPEVPFDSIVGIAVSDFASVPEEFVRHTLPAGAYVKVTHQGPESEIDLTYDSIREQGLCDCRPFDFEYWPKTDSLEQAESEIEIYLPL
ncbi:GyrI-like domain-containing protein [Cohnella boryungensis]|uniref:GyrI-like domain-containing protein n=1 Tax=Cohnella boryungensis TaxID=768479 RepID=A0ABV8SIW1_9BACL